MAYFLYNFTTTSTNFPLYVLYHLQQRVRTVPEPDFLLYMEKKAAHNYRLYILPED